jgi:hypothetical protein
MHRREVDGEPNTRGPLSASPRCPLMDMQSPPVLMAPTPRRTHVCLSPLTSGPSHAGSPLSARRCAGIPPRALPPAQATVPWALRINVVPPALGPHISIARTQSLCARPADLILIVDPRSNGQGNLITHCTTLLLKSPSGSRE